MSMLGQSLVLYLLIGMAVAVAVFLAQHQGSGRARWLRGLMVVPFWPLFLPLLLAREQPRVPGLPPVLDPKDELAVSIAQVETELDSALQSLNGWAAEVVDPDLERLRHLPSHWRCQALRIREMDRLLAETDPLTVATLLQPAAPGEDRLGEVRQARQQNLQRLRQVRDEAYGELLGNLASTREVVSRLLLAKFSGNTAGQAAPLLDQLFRNQS